MKQQKHFDRNERHEKKKRIIRKKADIQETLKGLINLVGYDNVAEIEVRDRSTRRVFR